MTPELIQEFLTKNSHRFDLPQQYLGDEPNVYAKPWDTTTTRWLVAASWPYETAAGNSSIPAVYTAINAYSDTHLADRWYLPATPRDLKTLQRHRLPIFGIESKQPAQNFDVVATSIAYPVLIFSFVKYLTMSNIPARRTEREDNPEDYPFIVIGGQAYASPEFLSPVADCVWLGEVEDEPGNPGIGEVTTTIERFKAEGRWQSDRLACYRHLAATYPFLYFPRFTDTTYAYVDKGRAQPAKVVQSIQSSDQSHPLPRTKRHVKDLNAIPPLSAPPLLYADPSMGSGDIEVARGCPAWCSFCALTYRQKPYRQRSVEYMTQYATEMRDNMGSTRLVPIAPDFPMHTQKKALFESLMTKVSSEVDAGAMRVDDFIEDPRFILLQIHSGMDDVTLGLEGNSRRMRDLVGKGTTDADVVEAVTRGIRAGIRKFKLFMISSLPSETHDDVRRILELGRALAEVRDNANQPNIRIQFSWTPLLVEANTPLQWFAPTQAWTEMRDVLDELKALKIEGKLGTKTEPNRLAFFQACNRASADVGEALLDTMLQFDTATWNGVPRGTKEALETHLIARGFHNGYEDIFDERTREDLFGWEHVDQGINPDLLWTVYVQMREFAEETEAHNYDEHFDDRLGGNEWVQRCDVQCVGSSCGVCDEGDLRLRRAYIEAKASESTTDVRDVAPIDDTSVRVKVRARIERGEQYRFVPNDHWRFAVRRAGFKAAKDLGHRFTVSKRSIRFVSDATVYRDWTTGVDYVEFGLTQRVSESDAAVFLERMNAHLEGRIVIGEWMFHPAESKELRSDAGSSLWQVEAQMAPEALERAVRAWDSSEYVRLVLKPDGRQMFSAPPQEVNAKDYCSDVWVSRRGHRVFVMMLIEGKPSPYEVFAALVGKSSWIEVAQDTAMRVEAFVGADDGQYDFFRLSCEGCGRGIPTMVLGQAFHDQYCPKCLDRL